MTNFHKKKQYKISGEYRLISHDDALTARINEFFVIALDRKSMVQKLNS